MMKLRVLLVDDSSTMRHIIQTIIEMSRLPVEKFMEAGNGQEGLAVLAAEKVDLVLLDLNMPVMGGLEMIEQMRKKPLLAKVPVIVISTESSQTRIDEIKAHGIHFIHKPFTPTRFREIIERALEGEAHAAN